MNIRIPLAVLLSAMLLPALSQGALIGPAGHTNDFATLPAIADWATADIPGTATSINTMQSLNTAVQAINATNIRTQLVASTGVGANSPAAQALATWSSDGQFIQTRSSGVAATVLMANLVNASGTNQEFVTINFDFATNALVMEDLPAWAVYYSVQGIPGTWREVLELTAFHAATMQVTLALGRAWTNGSTLYLLLADDNAAGPTDTALQLDNFRVRWEGPGAPASVGPGGYTNSFATTLSLEGWSTRPISNNVTANPANIPSLDALVQPNPASLILTPPGTAVGNLPDASGMAVWSTGGFLQTRPTVVPGTLLLARLANATGQDINSALISYDFRLGSGPASAAGEQINGHRVFFSHTGQPNSWTNLPSLTATNTGRYATNVSLGVWPNGGTMYLLWADANGTTSPDAAYQIDNFSVAFIPILLSHPQSQVVTPGATVTLAATAAGAGPLAYQWRFEGQNIPGANTPTLILTNIQAHQAGSYVLVVSNPAGSAQSMPATISMESTCIPAAVSQSPLSTSTAVGGAPTFTVSATGTLPLAYQWRFEGAHIEGATNAVLTIANAMAGKAGRYDVVVTNRCGSSTSEVAVLVVREGLSGFVWNDLNADRLWQRGLLRGTNLVLVLDNSSSTMEAFGGGQVPDVNQDGQANTILDAELLALIALNDRLVAEGLGSSVRVAVIPFAASAAALDLNPVASGIQIAALPSADADQNGVRDVEQALRAVDFSNGTDYHNALQAAGSALQAMGGSGGGGTVLFLSDGEPNTVPYAQDVVALQSAGAHLRAFGAGTNASLAALQLIDPSARIFRTSEELVNFFNLASLGQDGEPGMPGVEVYLDLNTNGMRDPLEPTLSTLPNDPLTPILDEAGGYHFVGLTAGVYTVRQVVPEGYRQTFPPCNAPHVVTLAAGSSIEGLNFGNTALTNPEPPALLKTLVQGSGTVSVFPLRAQYMACETVTLTATPAGCYWAFGYWTDGFSNHTQNPLEVRLGFENCYTAVFTNLVPNCGAGAVSIRVNGRTGDPIFVTNRADVCLQSSLTNVVLRYTTDCSQPSPASPVFTNCFTIFYAGNFPDLFTTVIRAAAFDSNGLLVAQQACPVTIVLTNDCPGFYRLFATVRGGAGGLLAGGTVTLSPVKDPYPCGAVIDLQAIPAEGWEFMGWLGDAGGADPMASVTMTEPRCVDAVFGTRLTTQALPGGSIHRSLQGEVVPYGSLVRLVAQPDPGHYFTGWSGSASGTNATLNFTIQSANPALVAGFAQLSSLPPGQFTLSTRLEGRGAVLSRPYRTTYASGVLVTNTAQPDAGQQFLGWSGDTNGMIVLSPASMYLPMNANRSIRATFTRGPQMLVVECQGVQGRDAFKIDVSGEPDLPYAIQATSELRTPASLTQWTTLGVVSNRIGVATFLDRSWSTYPQRFYRAVATSLP